MFTRYIISMNDEHGYCVVRSAYFITMSYEYLVILQFCAQSLYLSPVSRIEESARTLIVLDVNWY